MKVVILAGGMGSRISEESHLIPKPLIEIGHFPILWHVMKIYSTFGFNDFIICLGYKGHKIKEYFSNYQIYHSDVTFDFGKNHTDFKPVVHAHTCKPWKVTLVDTGLHTMTGGRIKRIKEYLNPKEDFMLTYGDGVANVNISQLVDFHNRQKSDLKYPKLMTLTGVYPPGRFGKLTLNDKYEVLSMKEKPRGDGELINGGFFVVSPEVLDLIEDDSTIFEQGPMPLLAQRRQMACYPHEGFWQCMDTMRDKTYLEELWEKGNPPWENFANLEKKNNHLKKEVPLAL